MGLVVQSKTFQKHIIMTRIVQCKDAVTCGTYKEHVTGISMKAPTAIDLFCGAGGLSEGFRQAGFHILAGNDLNEVAGRTFTKTHPHAVFVAGPIQNLIADDLLKLADLACGELDCLIGGPPCQDFSSAASVMKAVDGPA